MINKIESKIPALMKRIYQQGGADRLQAINITNKSLPMIQDKCCGGNTAGHISICLRKKK